MSCIYTVCLIGMSRSRSVTFSLNSLLFLVEVSHPGCLLGGMTQCWSQGCHQTLSSLLICLAGPSCLALSLKLRPEMYWFV